MPILPKASLFLRFSVILFVLPTPSTALPPDDLHLFFTIFIVLFLSAIVISVGFAAALYLFCRKKSEKNWTNSRTFAQWDGQPTKMQNVSSPFSAQSAKFTEQKNVSHGISMPNRFLAFCSSVANSLRVALWKISEVFKSRHKTRPPFTHFPSESPQPSYISVMSPNEMSPQQYHQFPSPPPPNGSSSSSHRLRSILKKPRTVPHATALPNGTDQRRGTVAPGATTVSYRIPVLRAANVPRVEPRAAPRPQVPRKWEWHAHFREFPPGDRVVEDRVEREECLRNGRLMAVERLTRTIRASADIGGQSATYI
ncbi:hypothetical protein niasHT_014105 [Heterodera trifolii]|uniref:Uncharacterized protein n=1 Tax=Heterodera trifolii TaxID=157864 RepID=A0ABD2LGD0_9BILA